MPVGNASMTSVVRAGWVVDQAGQVHGTHALTAGLHIEARRRGLTAGSFVEVLLEAWVREQRFAAIRQSMAQTSPDLVESCRAEASALDSLVGDGHAGDGREQSGCRPVLVVAADACLETVTALAMVLPVTTVDRGWPNHVRLRGRHGLDRPSWAMTEQLRAIERDHIAGVVGLVDDATLCELDVYLRDFLGL